jgi:hypothetical protein
MAWRPAGVRTLWGAEPDGVALEEEEDAEAAEAVGPERGQRLPWQTDNGESLVRRPNSCIGFRRESGHLFVQGTPNVCHHRVRG